MRTWNRVLVASGFVTASVIGCAVDGLSEQEADDARSRLACESLTTEPQEIEECSDVASDAAVAELGTVWVVREHLGRLVVWAYSQNGSISAIYPLPQLEEAIPPGESLRSAAPLPCVAQRLNLFVALGPRLARLGRDGAVTVVDLPSPVVSLHASTSPDRPMVAATFEHGGHVVFDGPDIPDFRRFSPALPAPLVTFTRDGALIAVTDREGFVNDTSDGRLREKASFPVLGGRPVAAVPGPGAGEFALVMPGGEVRVYRLPDRPDDRR